MMYGNKRKGDCFPLFFVTLFYFFFLFPFLFSFLAHSFCFFSCCSLSLVVFLPRSFHFFFSSVILGLCFFFCHTRALFFFCHTRARPEYPGEKGIITCFSISIRIYYYLDYPVKPDNDNLHQTVILGLCFSSVILRLVRVSTIKSIHYSLNQILNYNASLRVL